MSASLEELILQAGEEPSPEILDSIRKRILESPGSIAEDDLASQISFLLESWEGEISSDAERAAFCLDIAVAAPSDSSRIRSSLGEAFKALVPPGRSRAAASGATGLRNASSTLDCVVRSFRNFLLLEPGLSVYMPTNSTWFTIREIDEIEGQLKAGQIGGNHGRERKFKLESVLDSILLFKHDETLLSALEKKNISDWKPSEWRELLAANALNDLPPEFSEKSAFELLVPGEISLKRFKSWWAGSETATGDTEVKTEATPRGRGAGEARSLAELMKIVSEARKKGVQLSLSGEEREHISSLLKRSSENRNAAAMTAAVVSGLSNALDEKSIHELSLLFRGTFFLPDNPRCEKKCSEFWNSFPVRDLPPFIEVALGLFSEDYIAELCFFNMPPSLWDSVSSLTQSDALSKIIHKNRKTLHPGALLWIWKNRKKVQATDILTIENVLRSVDRDTAEHEGRLSEASRRLKKLLLENREFQKLILNNNKSARRTPDLLVKSPVLDTSESQSLLVKLSRLDSELKKILESGKGRALFSHGKDKIQSREDELLTSIKSYNSRVAELNGIINRQIPENTAAIAHARSYGDLRENAEYKAAKERQAFLSKRRAELERDLNVVKSMSFEGLETGDSVSLGTRVRLEHGSEQEETFCILGIWDTDTGRNHISYISEMGKALLGRSVGEDVLLPDGQKAKIVAINEIPDSLKYELSNI